MSSAAAGTAPSCPSPGPPPPEPAPGRARPGRVSRDILNHPALTGTDPAALDAWAASLEDTIAALGGPAGKYRRRGSPPRLTAAGLVTATRILSYLGISQRVLAPFPGIHPATFCQALRPVTRALAGVPAPPAAPPPHAAPRTRDQLTAYAAGHGIDLSIPEPGKAPTAPEATLGLPGTPQTLLILKRLQDNANANHVFDPEVL